jgi:hypothetical protein
MSSPEVTFEVEGRSFIYTKMKLRDQMKLWPKLAKDLGPILPTLGELQDSDDDGLKGISKLVESAAPLLENVEFYLDVFSPKLTTDWDGKPVKLKPFEDQILTSPKVVVLLLVECVKAEFGEFLKDLGVQAGQ